MYHQAAEIWKRTLPEGHPDLTTSCTNLAAVCAATGRTGDRVLNALRLGPNLHRRACPRSSSPRRFSAMTTTPTPIGHLYLPASVKSTDASKLHRRAKSENLRFSPHPPSGSSVASFLGDGIPNCRLVIQNPARPLGEREFGRRGSKTSVRQRPNARSVTDTCKPLAGVTLPATRRALLDEPPLPRQ